MKTKLILCFLLGSFICQAQWQNLYSFNDPACSLMTLNGFLYAGLAGGGVYMSPDSGYTWVPRNNGIQFGGAYIFSLASRNDSLFAGGFGEVCFSNDGGSNWSLLDLNLDLNDYVYSLLPKDNYLFAGVGHGINNGVWRKRMNGSAWSQAGNGLPGNASVNALTVYNDFLLAATDSGVYASSDDGGNWSKASNGINTGLAVRSLVCSHGNILAGTTDGVFVSPDTAASWSRSAGLPSGSVGVCFTGNDAYVVTGTYESVYFSPDHGLTWLRMSNGLDSIVSFYSMTSMGDYIYAGTGAGITTTNSVFKLDYRSLSVHGHDPEMQEGLTVSPNPFSDFAMIRINPAIKNAMLTIYDISGKRVRTIENISGGVFCFSRDKLPGGLYLFCLTANGKIVSSCKAAIDENR